MIGNQRLLFGVPEAIAYFNCAYTSPLPEPVLEAGRQALELKRSPWLLTPDRFFTDLEEARAAFSRVLGTKPEAVAVVPSVSYAMAVAAKNLPLAQDKAVLILDEQFPSNVYSWLKMAPGRVRAVPRPAEGTWSDAVLSFITEEIGLVALPHCHWVDGTVFDLAAVRRACDTVGAHLVVDATQSLGAMEFDLAAVRPDILAVAGHKWLLGPYGVGFCYVDERWRGGEPLEENWLNREGSEDFSRLTEYRDGYRPGARRYDVGEASNFILMPMATAALTPGRLLGGREHRRKLERRHQQAGAHGPGLRSYAHRGERARPAHDRASHAARPGQARGRGHGQGERVRERPGRNAPDRAAFLRERRGHGTVHQCAGEEPLHLGVFHLRSFLWYAHMQPTL